MIPVVLAAEPASFNATVRVPGKTFIRRMRPPLKSSDFDKHQYWTECLSDLRTSYREVCAYSGCYTPEDSVDHYKPKVRYPYLAYEWSNYRLAHQKINGWKADKEVLDPFSIQPNWFVLNLKNFHVEAGSALAQAAQAAVLHTITSIGLNKDTFVRLRFSVLKDYSRNLLPITYLDERYPFLSHELRRQNQVDAIKGTIA